MGMSWESGNRTCPKLDRLKAEDFTSCGLEPPPRNWTVSDLKTGSTCGLPSDGRIADAEAPVR